AGEYYGAGGVYYGHLSGPTASALPAISALPPLTPGGATRPIGGFNTVTEIGIGLRVGIGKSYSQGPLSASFMVVVQAIFEGVFSTFTQYPVSVGGQPPAILYPQLGVTSEYFHIVASVG